MRHKVGAHEIRQIAIISYSPVIQIKLYKESDTTVKIQQFQLSKTNKAKQHVLQTTVIYCEPGPLSKCNMN